MEIITKRAFGKRCGVSMPTVYKWIGKNKDGIAAFVHEDGIDEAIFNAAPWSVYKSADAINAEDERRRVKELEQELDRVKTDTAREIEQQQGIITQQAQIIDLLRAQIGAKDTQIKELHIILDRQLKALPQPKQRRTFLEWLGVKKQQPEQTEQ